MSTPFAEVPSALEVMVVGALVLLLFGGSRLPRLMRGLDEGIRGFRSAVCQIDDVPHPTGQTQTPRMRVGANDVFLIGLVVVALVLLLIVLTQR